VAADDMAIDAGDRPAIAANAEANANADTRRIRESELPLPRIASPIGNRHSILPPLRSFFVCMSMRVPTHV
jgi:hypothetical protein